tara:strand:- start:365 stop:928 length:564 start_codon:yes stop_codon:yes gene_type:complete
LVRLYHGTGKENADKIIKDGFNFPKESSEFFHGRGTYFSLTPEGAAFYAGRIGTVLEADYDGDFTGSDGPCELDATEAAFTSIGIYDQFIKNIVKNWRPGIENEVVKVKQLYRDCFAEYYRDERDMPIKGTVEGNSERCWDGYQNEAERVRQDWLSDGCLAMKTGNQAIFYDKDELKKLKNIRIYND